MSDFKTLDTCLCCGSADIAPLLDLGEQPLANSYHSKDESLPAFPLGGNRCSDCFHVQQFVAVNPDLMFKNYLYVSGTSTTLHEYFEWFAEEVSRRLGNGSESRAVLDIACNDGSQLAAFIRQGWQGYGVDPAENLSERARSTGATIVTEYWDHASADALGRDFDAIVAQNVLAHVSDPLGFLLSCKRVMHGTSKLFVQTSQADMFSRGEFDTIYHEHISFFSARSFQELARRAGLVLEDIFITPVHGGSYVFVLSVNGDPAGGNARIELEEAEGRYDHALYERFASGAKKTVKDLADTIDAHRAKGMKIVGFGAAAKGNTVLNFGKINLDYIVDDNPLKQGLYTPGMDIRIEPTDVLARETEPLVIVPLAWNFFDEISRKVKALRNNPADVFISYFPSITVRS